ncbi:hypothetical protein [Virgisporangium aurantiacum]|uniref:Uncharacterized protein n=1 Tax=Virgisporangium aurantiacum TaxID=175570 RepID=A0A8J3ZLE0_9ACTN|nr:hypothetical protein [Virgisporangium aurantiacum]GIJ64938.1 hypothetical protein Vau01_124540 [Virgisporangium aurantiacum]
MIEINFTPRAEDRSWLKTGWPAESYTGRLVDLDTLSKDDLTSWFFLVDVTWKVNSVDLSLKTPGLPIVEFILMLDLAEKQLDADGVSRVETTDTQDVLFFSTEDNTEDNTKDGTVWIRTSYTAQTAEVPRSEFDAFLVDAPNRAVDLIVSHHPELWNNAFLHSLRRTDSRSGDPR